MMMDDLTQEEIKIIMDLRKVEIDNKIKIDKEKMNLFISLYLKKGKNVRFTKKIYRNSRDI